MIPKLSLWILKDALEKFSPTIQCKETSLSITEIRLYQPGMKTWDHILYVGPSDSFFRDGKASIVCKHHSDYLYLNTCDLSAVFNCIQDTFSRYAKWHFNCTQAISKGCSLHTLLDCAREIFSAPILIVNAAQILVAHTPDLSRVIAPEDQDSVAANSSLPEEKIKQFNQVYKDTFYTKGIMVIPPGFFPTKSYCYHILINEERLGTVILKAPDADHTTGTLHLLELFTDLVKEWIQSNEEHAASFRMTSNFAYALDEKSGALSALLRQLSLLDWKIDCKKQVVVIASPDSQVHLDLHVSRSLAKGNLGILSLCYRNRLVLLCNLDMLNHEEFTQNLCSIMKDNNYYGAFSVSFTDLDQLLTAYQQALIAAENSPQIPGTIFRCQDAAIYMVVGVMSKSTSAALIHPALTAIKTYDQLHKTNYCQTLRCFLRNERRHQQTAKELFIHRNTLFLRLEKIQEIWPLDLDDPDERLHLLLSLYRDQYATQTEVSLPNATF